MSNARLTGAFKTGGRLEAAALWQDCGTFTDTNMMVTGQEVRPEEAPIHRVGARSATEETSCLMTSSVAERSCKVPMTDSDEI